MGSDLMVKAAVPKDFGKKKRTNRLAKLRQEKLEARREQWLSKAKNNGFKEESNNGNDSIRLPLPPKDEQNLSLRNPEMGSRGDESNVEFITNTPVNCVSGGNESRKNRPGSSSGSCSSNSGCFSGTISEEEEEVVAEEEDDECLDWEAVADALIADDKQQIPSYDCLAEKEIPVGDPPEMQKLESNSTALSHEAKRHAWSPDDAYRPQSLPNLSKQFSFSMNPDRHCRRGVSWSCHNVTSQPSCPICYEDLDLTDSSFLPCSCGFRLCLFCHKRILEFDGRCPGCRKQYADPLNRDKGAN